MKVNFNKLLLLLMPTFLRKGVLKAFLNAVSEALKYNKAEVDLYFKEINYHIRVTPQTFSLEKMLNDKCDNEKRRIFIKKKKESVPPFYFFDSSNPKMQYFSNGEYFMLKKSNYLFDFFVYLPKEMEGEEMTNYVSALLNNYKLLSKTFKIEYI